MDLKERLTAMIHKDKQETPQFLCDVIKSDFFYLINNYFEVSFDDIKVTINANKTEFEIVILCAGDRVKLIKTLPS